MQVDGKMQHHPKTPDIGTLDTTRCATEQSRTEQHPTQPLVAATRGDTRNTLWRTQGIY